MAALRIQEPGITCLTLTQANVVAVLGFPYVQKRLQHRNRERNRLKLKRFERTTFLEILFNGRGHGDEVGQQPLEVEWPHRPVLYVIHERLSMHESFSLRNPDSRCNLHPPFFNVSVSMLSLSDQVFQCR